MVAIVGPTGVGKSQFALRLARYFSLEIINADSRQVYRYMDIGTNKPTVAERALVPHHIIDVVNPDEHFSLAIYHQLAERALENIERRGNIAFMVGGTGLYIWSLVEGWKIPQVPPDPKLRDELEQRARREGSYSLYRELQSIDPITASKIDPANVRRIIRALEIYQATKRPPSQLQGKETPKFRVLIIGLTQERSELYKKIDYRVDKMIKEGLIEEVRGLLARGYSPSLPSMSGIGYREVVRFLQGEMTLSQTIERIKYETHRLARHQYAWFRLSDTRIKWFDVGDISKAESGARKLIEDFLAS